MEKFEPLIITGLSCETALDKAKTLATVGLLQQREDYCYLKINDDYIHFIHPMLEAYGIIDKPAYFDPPDDVGAHISLIYPEENVRLLQTNVFFNDAQLLWEKGKDNVAYFKLEGTRKQRAFCKTCGSPLPRQEGEGHVTLPAGTLDEDDFLNPTAHIFYASRSSWEDKIMDLKRFDELPK